MQLELVLELECGVGKWYPNVARGVDHFIEYLRFMMMSLVKLVEAPVYVKYFICGIQPILL